jgi:hypothetical protein
VGLDLVSLESAYSGLHAKLVRSYTLESLLEGTSAPSKSNGSLERSRAFLREAATAEESKFQSLGYGIDHRFKGKALGGTALVHRDEVIHAAFFKLDDEAKPAHMASVLSRRRRFIE